MTDVDARLKAMFAADLPPAPDARFRLAVMERMEKRQAAVKLAVVVGFGVVATVGVGLLSPQLSQILPSNMLLIGGAVLGSVASVWGVLQMRRPI